MAETSLIVCDENCNSYGRHFSSLGHNIGNIVDDYIDILDSIRQTSILEGDVAACLDQYIACAKNLEGVIATVSDNLKETCQQFVTDVDAADDFLF